MADEARVRSAVAEALMVEPDELSPEVTLESLPEYDSVAQLTLMVALSDVMGRPLDHSTVGTFKTYGDIVEFVNRG